MQLTFAARDRLIAGESKYDGLPQRPPRRRAGLRADPRAPPASPSSRCMFSDSDLIRTFGEAGLDRDLIALLAVLMLVPLLGVLLMRKEAALRREGAGRRTPASMRCAASAAGSRRAWSAGPASTA